MHQMCQPVLRGRTLLSTDATTKLIAYKKPVKDRYTEKTQGDIFELNDNSITCTTLFPRAFTAIYIT